MYPPRIDPPYPSITFVLSTAPPQLLPLPLQPNPPPRNARSSRLPAYRVSHMGRYHPYPRVAPAAERCEDPLMSTVDYRYVEEPLWEEESEASVDSGHATAGGQTVGDEASANVEPSPIASTDSVSGQTATDPGSQLSRSKFVTSLSEMIVMLRRKYLSLQFRTFLKAQHLKTASG
ncbi:hypothetical protein GY45DRAFT_1336403 [Cubamyces sp. BRFM 1775]|nr:hypothetical protein GY45DRAFT_1336403 [Cubamyces sp. BRFM 1775]